MSRTHTKPLTLGVTCTLVITTEFCAPFSTLNIPDWNRVCCFLGRVWFGLTFVKLIARPLLGTPSEGPGAFLSIPGICPALLSFSPQNPQVGKHKIISKYWDSGGGIPPNQLPLGIPRNSYAFGMIHLSKIFFDPSP